MLPEYGRHVHQMVDYLMSIHDRDLRNQQARAETTFVIEPDLQSEENGAVSVAEGVKAYAFYVNGEWSVNSYEEALATTITNTESGETLNQPSETAEAYADADPEGRLSMKTSSPP